MKQRPAATWASPSRACSLVQLKLEDRSVVPRDVVRHMRSTVSPASPWRRGGGGGWAVWAGPPMVAGTVCLPGPRCLLLPRTASAAP